MKILLALLIGCAADPVAPFEPNPSCGQSIAQFYDNGCVFDDASGKPIPLDTMVTTCVGLAMDAPSDCDDEFDAWMLCLDQPPPKTGKAPCGCSSEQAAFASCK